MTDSFVGVDVGGTSIRAVRFDAALQPQETSTGPTPTGGATETVVAAIAEHVRAVQGAATAIGVGVPGHVDAVHGVVASALNLGIDAPVPLGELLAARTGLPVHVENDVNAAALGAFHVVAPSATASLAYVNVGTGIAAGFVIGGRLWRGASGAAGEIGHIPMWSHGPVCVCGQRGCAEAVGSGRALGADGATGSRLADMAAVVAWAVQLCVMTLDVDVVALGGGLTRSPAVVTAVRASLEAREAASPTLVATGLARRLTVVPADVPVGSLGAVLALAERHRSGAP